MSLLSQKDTLRFLFFPICFWAIIACDLGTETAGPADMVLANATLIDGTGAGPVTNAVLVVQGGIITKVGKNSETAIPAGLPVIDLEGRTILPGFINAHVHSAYVRENLEQWARAGVTTVRDLCGSSSITARDQCAPDPRFARIVAAGVMMSVPGGYPHVPWRITCMLTLQSAEEARIRTRQVIETGSDVIKVAVESGLSFGMVIPTLSVEQVGAIVETAHEEGTVVSAHVLATRDLQRAVQAGADDIAHMVYDIPPDSTLLRMVAQGVYWVPTIELWMNVNQDLGNQAIANLRRFVSAGGKVALGTDFAGYDRPFELGMPMKEMEWMLDAGMTAMDVIVAGTRNAAIVCNRGNDLGTLEAGKIADILVLDGNPLQDIHALRNVHMVIHNGVKIR